MGDRTASVAAIRKAYIDPIRTVMLVDDEFSTFGELARPGSRGEPATLEVTASEGAKREDERAGALWEACRAHGWACDIENRFSPEAIERIIKCDLVVLDFHLVPDDSAYSRQILRRLADSPGTTLVILYTKDTNLHEVRRKVAATLRGTRPVRDILTPEALAAWVELPDAAFVPSAENVDSFLRGEEEYKGNQALLDQFGTALSRPLRIKLAEAAFEQFLLSSLGAEQRGEARILRMSNASAEHGWIRQGNVFVVFVSKEEPGGEQVLRALEGALTDSNPSPLHLTAAYARESIGRGGLQLDANALSDVRLRVGLLRHALDEAPSEGLRYWYERLIESVASHALERVAEFGGQLIEGPSGDATETTFARAVTLAIEDGDKRPSEYDAMEALNQFLCSESYRGKHVTTGTIFRMVDELARDTYWVCVTPACDMDPREPKEHQQWAFGLHPLRPMSVLRAPIAKMSTALGKATIGHHVFFFDHPASVAVEVINVQTTQPVRELMLVDDRGVTDSDFCFVAYFITRRDGVPHFGEKVRMRAVAQLRPQHASRLLQEAGSHAARIGVDFANHESATPKPPRASGDSGSGRRKGSESPRPPAVATALGAEDPSTTSAIVSERSEGSPAERPVDPLPAAGPTLPKGRAGG